ncbi:MAG: polyprenyl synthetase family protein [Gammaproteobacteria bacterium]|nr:polyprenyl synthetase family protein [Gammaproteobacteria bacterium]
MDTPKLENLVPIPDVWDRMRRVETRLAEVSKSDYGFLTDIAQHLLLAGGKRFRPLLAQIAGEFGRTIDDRVIDAGVAVEFIHVGSLYHDDVIDEAETRRGTGSANTNWGNTIAILAGDFLMARATELAADTLGREAVQLLSRTYAELVEGQTLELQLDFDVDHGPDEYYRVVEMKTASLIRTSARVGAMATDATPATVDALSAWAWELGVIFQITDDALDLVATDEFLGKPAGSDIGEGKFTLPLLYALEGTDGPHIRELLAERPYTARAIDEVIRMVRAGGFVDQVLDEARTRSLTAASVIADLPPIPSRNVLAGLGDYLLAQVEYARS